MLGPALELVDRNYVLYEGKKLLYFGGTDYHRLSTNPMIKQAMIEAIHHYGISCTGSRTTTGNHPLYAQLEDKLANFFDTEASLVIVSGYLTNICLLQAIGQEYDIIFIDKLAHSSIVDAAKLMQKKLVFFEHIDPHHLQIQLRKYCKPEPKGLIMTDGIFASQGEIAPLDEYKEIARKYDVKILIDDAHGMAVMGETGKGCWEEKGISREETFQTGTLSKGFGILGGIITGDSSLIRKIYQQSLAFISSTGLALPLVAAAIQSINYLHKHIYIIKELQKKSLELKKKLREVGFDFPQSSAPIISITHENEKKNQKLYRLLLQNGIYPSFLYYPGSPPGGHFRFALSSLHSQEHIDLLYHTISMSW